MERSAKGWRYAEVAVHLAESESFIELLWGWSVVLNISLRPPFILQTYLQNSAHAGFQSCPNDFLV